MYKFEKWQKWRLQHVATCRSKSHFNFLFTFALWLSSLPFCLFAHGWDVYAVSFFSLMAVFAVFWYTDLSEEKEPFLRHCWLRKKSWSYQGRRFERFFFFLWKAKQLISSSVPYINSINALISKKFLCISFFSAVNFSSNCILPPHKLIKSH